MPQIFLESLLRIIRPLFVRLLAYAEYGGASSCLSRGQGGRQDHGMEGKIDSPHQGAMKVNEINGIVVVKKYFHVGSESSTKNVFAQFTSPSIHHKTRHK